jgi:chromosomal replication initiation ATPase DnaA
VLDVLRQTIGEQRVAVYLRDSGPLSCEDGTLVVAVHSTLAQDWLESRHYAALCAAVEQVTGQRLRLRLVARRLRPL